jgi:hypothetical protein
VATGEGFGSWSVCALPLGFWAGLCRWEWLVDAVMVDGWMDLFGIGGKRCAPHPGSILATASVGTASLHCACGRKLL